MVNVQDISHFRQPMLSRFNVSPQILSGFGAVHVVDTVIENGYARVAPADRAGYADSLRTMTVGPFAELKEAGAFVKEEATLNPGTAAPPGTESAGLYYGRKLAEGYCVLVPRSFDPLAGGQKLLIVKDLAVIQKLAPPALGDYAVLFTPADVAKHVVGFWTPVTTALAVLAGAGVLYLVLKKR